MLNDLVELVCEYRSLVRRQRGHGRLSLTQRQRLDALQRLLGREPADQGSGDMASGSGTIGRRRYARCEVRLFAALSLPDRAYLVRVVDLGAGGVRVTAEEPIPAGTRGTLRIGVPESGRVYALAVDVIWSIGEGGGSIGQPVAGLRFRGAPAELMLAS